MGLVRLLLGSLGLELLVRLVVVSLLLLVCVYVTN